MKVSAGALSSFRAAVLGAMIVHAMCLTPPASDPLRKTGIFGPLKEVFAPYEPRDYHTVVAGQWETEMRR